MKIRENIYLECKAFTLIEVLIGLMIFASLTVITVPKLSRYQKNLQLETSVQKLLSDIRYVQQQSIITDFRHGIAFDCNKDYYYIIKNKSSPQILEKVRLVKTHIKEVNFPLYHKLHFSGAALFYKRLGNLDHRNGRIKLEFNHEVKEIIFSSNAGEINIKSTTSPEL